MGTRMDEVLRQALNLPEEERAEIAGALLESIEPPADVEIEQAWREEVARRIAALDAGQARTVPWEEVREQLYARLRASRR